MRRQFVDILRSAGFLPQFSDAAGKLSSETGMLGGSAANENSGQDDVIKAVVAAGLYPNVVSVGKRQGRPSMRPPKLTVRGIGRVELHPKSALAGMAAFPQPYLVYGTLVRSSACFVHDASCVPIMALMLFGGKLSVKDVVGDAGTVVMTADNWLTLHVAADSAACVIALTQRLYRCLQAKFTTPSLDMYAPVLHRHNSSAACVDAQLHCRYGDSSFAAISRETLHLLRCSVTQVRILPTGAPVISASRDAGSGSDDDGSASAVDEQPLQLALFSKTYVIGGGQSGDCDDTSSSQV
jgi:hypothetical protein